MSLATRCTSCDTVFRVVQDQLKVSEGWVRCGRCDTVFNAVEGLFDLDRDGLPPNPSTGEPTPHESLPDLPSEVTPRPAPPQEIFDSLIRERSAARSPAPAPAPAPTSAPASAPASESSRPAVEEAAAAMMGDQALLAVPGSERAAAGTALPADGDDDSPPPEFLRHAERNARWQRPPLKWGLRVGVAVLALGLALQWMHHFRDGLSARAPGLRPLLAAWCSAAGCRIEAPRRIADLTVESTGLTPAAAGPGSFLLSVTLRNRGAWPVALPSVDLTLTDSNGQLVARRALAPGEFVLADAAGRAVQPTQTAPAALQPDSDTRLQATLATPPRVVGYSVEVFYP